MTYPVTELQLAILDVLWSRGESTVMELHDELRAKRRIAQSTVSTLLARLQDRGFVDYHEDGRRYVFRATVGREELRRSMAAQFLEHSRPLFQSDLGLLVSHLLQEGDATAEETRTAREILERMEQGEESE
jgi:predicted transcriptional regulator